MVDKKKKEEEIINSLKKEIDNLKKEKDELKNKYLRALADYQNFEKRVNEEKKLFFKLAKKDLLIKLLPIVDSLDKAEIFIKDQGLKMVKEQFVSFLKEEKVQEIDVLNKPFDPTVAEAVEVVEGKEDNLIVEVVRKGYRLEDFILRVAQVKVSKKINKSNQNKL